MKRVSVIGAGAWGTALAIVANRAACDVTLWDRSPELVSNIKERNQNLKYLKGVFVDPAIKATNDLAEACDAELVIMATPAQYIRASCINLSNFLRPAIPVVVSSKGIEIGSLMLMSDVVKAVLPSNPVAILSGPNFAHEIAAGLPAATTIACHDKMLGEQISFAIGSTLFRPYYTNDVVGAQVGGALKNVIAIACGISVGKEMGDNARAALVTRGMAEIKRMCIKLGGKPETLLGLAGMGDLVLTCMSSKSRNLGFGISLGKGVDIEELLANHAVTTEGVPTSTAAASLASRFGVDMPICQAVSALINQKADVNVTITNLLSRQFTVE